MHSIRGLTQSYLKLYCLCEDTVKRNMIQCNNRTCRIKYFHYSCVSISTRTKGIWYCPLCRADYQNYRIGKIKVDPIIPDPNRFNIPNNRFCICRKFKYDDMIGCDNSKCKYQWFHYKCLKIDSIPDDNWYCMKCRAISFDYSLPKPGIISYIY